MLVWLLPNGVGLVDGGTNGKLRNGLGRPSACWGNNDFGAGCGNNVLNGTCRGDSGGLGNLVVPLFLGPCSV